jgi:hypothetical protein
MGSWRGGADGIGSFGSDILLLLDDGVARRASPQPTPRQQIMETRKRRRRRAGRTQLHPRARSRIQHPRGHNDDHAGTRLDMHEASGPAILAVVPAKAPAMERMPAVVHHDVLPDMGRMTG